MCARYINPNEFGTPLVLNRWKVKFSKKGMDWISDHVRTVELPSLFSKEQKFIIKFYMTDTMDKFLTSLEAEEDLLKNKVSRVNIDFLSSDLKTVLTRWEFNKVTYDISFPILDYSDNSSFMMGTMVCEYKDLDIIFPEALRS
jgi:hypothetical protein